MIPIQLQPEPNDFYNKVQKRGENFLLRKPSPKGKDWENKEFWRDASDDMQRLYHGICAYCGIWISRGTGNPTVDHYISRHHTPHLAYTWTNFRLACNTLNGRKSNFQDVLDPFTLSPNWFFLDFSSWMIHPNPDLADFEKELVRGTINRLQLNADEDFIAIRRQWYEEFLLSNVSFKFFEEKAPFVAYEAQRQGLLPSRLP